MVNEMSTTKLLLGHGVSDSQKMDVMCHFTSVPVSPGVMVISLPQSVLYALCSRKKSYPELTSFHLFHNDFLCSFISYVFGALSNPNPLVKYSMMP